MDKNFEEDPRSDGRPSRGFGFTFEKIEERLTQLHHAADTIDHCQPVLQVNDDPAKYCRDAAAEFWLLIKEYRAVLKVLEADNELLKVSKLVRSAVNQEKVLNGPAYANLGGDFVSAISRAEEARGR